MPRHISGIGVINHGDDKVMERYVYKLKSTRYESPLYAASLYLDDRDVVWVSLRHSTTYHWQDVKNNPSPIQGEWIMFGKLIYSVE